MNIRLSVEEMLKSFGSTYRTIDIRSVMVKQGDKWINLYLVVRLTYEESSEVEARLQNLEKHHGVIRTKTFQILLGQRPFSEWGDLRQELAGGRVLLAGTEINLAQPVSLANEQADLRADYFGIRPFDSVDWPVTHYRVGPYSTGPQIDAGLARVVAGLGYSDIFEAVNLLCELNIRPGQPDSYHFWLSLPVFARVSDVRILTKERKLLVEINRHRRLTALWGNVVFRGANYYTTQPSKYRRTIEHFLDTSEDELLVAAVGSIDLPEVQNDDWAEAQVIHPDLGELHNSTNLVHRLFPPAERNILFEGLKFFCPESEFEWLLLRPYEKKTPRVKESAAFELRVAWLLGLLGLSTAVLGEYENIVVPQTKFRRGTADILAASQRGRSLVLVACTINAPIEDDFTKLLETAEILSRELYADTNVRIFPLVCTATVAYAPYRDSGDGVTGVPVLDADRLKLVLKLIGFGREPDVLSFICNPKFSPLRDPDAPLI